jgi:hypothetical protein
VKNLRRVVLGLVLLACFLGAKLRLTADNPVEFNFDRLTLSNGQMAGPFLVERSEARVGKSSTSLRLRLPQCQRPIVLEASAFSDTLPEKLLARLYPSAEWDARYVYHRHLFSSFADLPPKFIMRLRLLFLDLTLQPREVTDNYVFSFHVPVGCAIDSGAALAAVDSLIASQRAPGP